MRRSLVFAAIVLPPLLGAQQAAKPALTETDELRFTAHATTDTIRWVQFVRNDGDSASILTCVSAALKDTAGHANMLSLPFSGRSCNAADTGGLQMPSSRVTPVPLAIPIAMVRELPVSGYVVFTFREKAKRLVVNRAINIRSAEARGRPYSEYVVRWTLIVAALVAFLAIVGKGLTTPIPQVEIDWKKSWASNASIAGGIVAALIGAAYLPDDPHYLTKKAYTLLTALFAAVSALAPAAYLFVAKLGNKAGKPALATASTFILWSAFAQTALAGLLFGELVHAQVLPQPSVTVFWVVLVVLVLLLAAYAIASIRDMLKPTGAAGSPFRPF